MSSTSGNMMRHAPHKVLKLDANTCRIECGCGCHRNIDPLPNSISPHIPSINFYAHNIDFLSPEYSYIIASYIYIPKIPIRPPDFIS